MAHHKSSNHKHAVIKKYEDLHFVDTSKSVWNYSLFTDEDIKNFHQGTHYQLYNLFGARLIEVNDRSGIYFSVWAPNATKLSVIGNFNSWNEASHPLYVRLDKSGIWEGFIPDLPLGEVYKYHIHGFEAAVLEKADPFACHSELRPNTGSVTSSLQYKWQDEGWMKKRKKHNALNAPWSVYEVHLASWMRPDKSNEEAYNSYEQITDRLVPYVKEMGFTHVELMPVMEYPFDGSWGYQCTGYFAATSRFGNPQGLMHLIDSFHQAGIGVILDWVPSHFPNDAHGLYNFDGTHTYEYADMQKGFHPDWNSYIFNYGRGEVKSFLISNARFWFDLFHIDGIRVDAVSSMLKLNYSREDGQWEPNVHGGDGNLEAIEFVKDLNTCIYRDFPDVQTIAEESTDWPNISKPIYKEGLGFGMKWMMGWMHDTLDYFKIDPIYRQHHQDKFSFSMMYFYDENFMLPFSHDEVVHGKSPMLYKMPGDEWQKFANMRLQFAYMYTHPGAKLLFMGNEFGATEEWNYKSELQWHLLQFEPHHKLQACIRDLNYLLKSEPALYEKQFELGGFEWADLNHRNECVIVYKRMGKKSEDDLLIILNLANDKKTDWKLKGYDKKFKKILFNSDDVKYWGAGFVNGQETKLKFIDSGQKDHFLKLNLPPLSCIIIK
jgi:1,4-alpha-glucan branching enzyme